MSDAAERAPAGPDEPGAVAGLRWARSDGDLVVAWAGADPAAAAALPTPASGDRTEHFEVHRERGIVAVLHRIAPEGLDDDVGDLIGRELVRPGLLRDVAGDPFERCLVGVVTSTAARPDDAWERFYRTCLARFVRPGAADGEGAMAEFADVYDHAARTILGAVVLDVGSCFGFFPLLLAAHLGVSAHGSDREPGTVALAARMARRLGSGATFRTLDVTERLPLRDGFADTVTALHVLEHLPEPATAGVLAELCRHARERVVVAVPLEDQPDATYGHVQAFDLARLDALGHGLEGWRANVHRHRGGWLVLDRES